MKSSRRDFVRTAAAATGAVGLGLFGRDLQAAVRTPRGAPAGRPAPKVLRILILGGTGFTGPFQVRYALERGHQVTVFNRGRTQPTVDAPLDEVEQLVGDRNDNLEALKGREWDAVIDNSASLPRWVRQTAELLQGSVDTYLFTSSLSVHSDESKVGITEDDPVATIADPTIERITGETYGALKALCEAETRKAFPDGAIVVRPHLIVGPGDQSDRWTYWPVRVARGGEVLAPGTPNDPTQYIDARDLAEFDIRLLEQRTLGTFAAVGPLAPLSMGEMLYGMRAVVSNDISFTWIDADSLEQYGVQAWSEMTAWVPPRGETAGSAMFSNARAVAAGLTYRPLAVTAKDTLDWWQTLPETRRARRRAGLAPEKEREVLAKWHEGGR